MQKLFTLWLGFFFVSIIQGISAHPVQDDDGILANIEDSYNRLWRHHDRVHVYDPWYHPDHVHYFDGYAYSNYYDGRPYYYYDPRFYYYQEIDTDSDIGVYIDN